MGGFTVKIALTFYIGRHCFESMFAALKTYLGTSSRRDGSTYFQGIEEKPETYGLTADWLMPVLSSTRWNSKAPHSMLNFMAGLGQNVRCSYHVVKFCFPSKLAAQSSQTLAFYVLLASQKS